MGSLRREDLSSAEQPGEGRKDQRTCRTSFYSGPSISSTVTGLCRSFRESAIVECTQTPLVAGLLLKSSSVFAGCNYTTLRRARFTGVPRTAEKERLCSEDLPLVVGSIYFLKASEYNPRRARAQSLDDLRSGDSLGACFAI